MGSSDWIALAACFAAFIGLIPQFHQAFKQNKKSKDVETQNRKSDNQGASASNPKEEEVMNPMIRVLVLTTIAVIVGLIELLVFNAVAYFSNVEVNLESMSISWKIGFYSLFLVPGILLFYAMMVLSTMFDD